MALKECPYRDCTFCGTAKEVEDHILYMVSFNDIDHTPDKYRDNT